MPEPGQTPQPSYKRGGNNLAYGEAAQVNDLVGMFPAEQESYEPAGEADEFLFAPTDRPAEPFSAGLAFGPGVGPEQGETDGEILARVSAQILTDPRAPKDVRKFAQRAQQGL